MNRNAFHSLAGLVLCFGLAFGASPARAQLRASSPAEQGLDAAAFQAVERMVAERMTDVQSVVVLLQGRVVYQFYRDGAPDKLRDQQSIQKSALSVLAGIALGQGKLASLDQPVVGLLPELAPLNADPRAAAITVRHLLTMTAAFDVNDASGTARWLPPTEAWARPLKATPGSDFAYDNSLMPVLSAVIEKATGMPIGDYARLQLVGPMQLAEPAYERGLQLRTLDMAKLGQLMLRDGLWDGEQIVPAAYVRAATEPQNAGGPPVATPYGYLWWVRPTPEPRRTFMASGYGGQLIWVHPPLEMVVALTSTVSTDSQRRGHAVELLRGGLVPAAQARNARRD